MKDERKTFWHLEESFRELLFMMTKLLQVAAGFEYTETMNEGLKLGYQLSMNKPIWLDKYKYSCMYHIDLITLYKKQVNMLT